MKNTFRMPEGDYNAKKATKGKTKAFFNVVHNETGLLLNDIRLFDGDDGPYVKGPARPYETNGEKKWFPYWRVAWNDEEGAYDENGVQFIEALTEFLVAEYERRFGRASSKAARAATGGGKSGGKARRVVEEEEGEEEEQEEKPAPRAAAKGGAKKPAPAAARRGRGPIVEDDDPDSDDLPF